MNKTMEKETRTSDFFFYNVNNEIKEYNDEENNKEENNIFLNSFVNIENDKNTFIVYDDKEEILSENEWEKIFKSKKNYSDLPIELKKKINNSLEKGIPEKLRFKIWKFLSQYDLFKLNYDKNLYENYLEKENKEIDEIISKDINRTFIKNNLITEEIKKKLFNVLKVYSIYDREIGYCQGTNFIVLTLLLTIKNEIDSFWIFVVIMNGKNWRNLFENGTPKLMLLMNKFLDELKKEIHDIYVLLENNDLIKEFPGIFALYFSNIFSYINIPFQLTNRIYDLFWIYEEKAIIGTLINLFKLKKNFLLNFNNSDELNLYIRNHLLNDCINDFGIDKIIYKSKNIRKSIHCISEREVPIK